MEIKSNGIFLKNNFDIDRCEELYYDDLDNNKANLLVWGYDKIINDLKVLPKALGDDEHDNLIYNCYVEFSKSGKYWFVISFYSYDEEYLDKDLLDKVKEYNQEIKIEINTEQEKILFKEKILNALRKQNFESIEEVFEEV